MSGFDYIDGRRDDDLTGSVSLRLTLPRMSPERFAGSLHERDYARRLGMSWGAFPGNMKAVRDRYRQQAVGYCDAGELAGRWARDREWAIMMEDADGAEFWFHFPMISTHVTDAETGLDAEGGEDPKARDDERRKWGAVIDDGR